MLSKNKGKLRSEVLMKDINKEGKELHSYRKDKHNKPGPNMAVRDFKNSYQNKK